MVLPPQPDPETGEPRPPQAPTQYGPRHCQSQRSPASPSGQGPTLEYFRESHRSMWLSAPIPVVLVLLISIWHGGTIVLTYWWLWVLLAAYLAWLVYKSRTEFIAAGAEWLATNRGWIRTYELTSIRYVVRAPAAHHLELTDRDNRKLVIGLILLQSNHRLWDHVYLGMRHSVANGAIMNRTARAQFRGIAAEQVISESNSERGE